MIGTLCIETSSSETIISVIVIWKIPGFSYDSTFNQRPVPYRLMGAAHILS